MLKFKHKTLGDIGSISFSFSAEHGLAIGGPGILGEQALTPKATYEVIKYGLKQWLTDSYAFPKDKPIDLAEAQKRFNARLEGIIAGTVATGDRETDAVLRKFRELLTAVVTKQVGMGAAAYDKANGEKAFARKVKELSESKMGETFAAKALELVKAEREFAAMMAAAGVLDEESEGDEESEDEEEQDEAAE